MSERDFSKLFLGRSPYVVKPRRLRLEPRKKPYAQSRKEWSHLKYYYFHSKLPSQSSFRVLELLPGNGTELVRFRLRVEDWNNPSSYEAISYTWGNAKDRLICECDGKELSITRSLYEALMQFRYPDAPRLLWADAVCINQLDKPELGHQVNNMRKIYQKATQTLIWLGTDPFDIASTAFAAINEFTEDMLWILKSTKAQVCNTANLAGLAAQFYHDRTTNTHWDVNQLKVVAIGELFKCPWFERLWVMQELNMSMHATTWWGTSCEDARFIAFVACCLLQDLDAKIFMESMTKVKCAAAMVQPALNMQQPSLLDVMHSTSFFKATDARDRVYAMLSTEIFQLQKEKLVPNYGISTEDLFQKFAEISIRSDACLDCLSYVGHEHERQDATNMWRAAFRQKKNKLTEHIFTPSWAPMWDSEVRSRHSALRASSLNFKACPKWLPPAKPRVVGSSLVVSGVIIDDIHIVRELDGTIMALIEDTKPYHLEAKRERFWIDFIKPWARYRDEELVDEVYGKTLTLGNTIRRHWSQSPYLLSNFLEDRFGNKPSVLASILKTHCPTASTKNKGDSRSYFKRADEMRMYMKRVREYMTLRRFIVTSRGFLGQGPCVTRVRDKVALLEGSRVPIILRPSTQGRYLVMGDAYIHGLMYGEVAYLTEFKDMKPERIVLQ